MFCVEAQQQQPQLEGRADSFSQTAAPATSLRAYRAHSLASRRCKLTLVTRGQRAVQPAWERSCGAAAAGGQLAGGSLALGLSKTLFMENRGAHGLALDLSPAADGSQLTAAQLAWLLQDSREYSCALRAGQLYVERLARPWSCARSRRVVLRKGAACVVTGGTKGLGLQYARNLAHKGAGTLVLTSRSSLLTKEELIELANSGACCRAVQCRLPRLPTGRGSRQCPCTPPAPPRRGRRVCRQARLCLACPLPPPCWLAARAPAACAAIRPCRRAAGL